MEIPAPLTPRSWLWGAAWGTAIAGAHILAGDLEPASILQFLVQYMLCAAAMMIPGLLAFNLFTARAPRLTLRWQVVAILLLASTLAAAPWTSTTSAYQ